MENDISFSVRIGSSRSNEDNALLWFLNSIEKLFQENYLKLEAIRLSQAENPIVELNTINNNEVMTYNDMKMRFFE